MSHIRFMTASRRPAFHCYLPYMCLLQFHAHHEWITAYDGHQLSAVLECL